jgi:hypothetical protein
MKIDAADSILDVYSPFWGGFFSWFSMRRKLIMAGLARNSTYNQVFDHVKDSCHATAPIVQYHVVPHVHAGRFRGHQVPGYHCHVTYIEVMCRSPIGCILL